MSAAKENPCRKFQANIFNKSKCQNCFKPRESHLLNDKDLTQVQTKEEPLPPASSQSIPTFYFPRGRPQGTVNVDAVIAKIERTFAQFPHERATMEDMGKVAKGGRQILRPALPVQPGSDCFASFIPCQPTYGCTERPHLHLLNY
ncbi:serine/threonine-protein phosphatase 2A regulatory subunit B'' subunit delta-like isoform X6 [Equus asinus]|uniref:serine/threonine-protein phosphatase 2A regulatory subunit B'' subunit delta-like isoform X6 n=1 Tax=Equus asinus TaxID=9793 RepID=UPI0038F76099